MDQAKYQSQRDLLKDVRTENLKPEKLGATSPESKKAIADEAKARKQ